MATGNMTFMVPVSELQLEETELATSHPNVEKILLESEDKERLIVNFHLTHVFSEEDALAVTRDILESIINRLAFEFDLSIEQPHMRGFTLPKDPSGASHTTSTSVLVTWNTVAPTVEPDATKRQELARLLGQPIKRNDLYSAYRFSVSQRDAVSRFMFLYSILLQTEGDCQKNVEDFIRRERPNVSQTPHPDPKKLWMETPYTRLRNEVAHQRKGNTPENTRMEIQDNLEDFQKLVKKAVSDQT